MEPMPQPIAADLGSVFHSDWFLSAAKALPFYSGVRAVDGVAIVNNRYQRLGVARGVGSSYSPLSGFWGEGTGGSNSAHHLPQTLKANGFRYLHLPYLGFDASNSAFLHDMVRTDAKPYIISQHERALALVSKGETGEDYLRRAMSAKRRKRGREAENRLKRLGHLSFETSFGKEVSKYHLEAYLTLEDKGWKGQSGSSFLKQQGPLKFLKTLVETSSEEQFSCHVLKVEDRAVAAGLCLHHGATSWYWKTAFDETLSHASPGVALTLELTKFLIDQRGSAILDSCADPGHPMIDGIWAERLPIANLILDLTPEKGWPLATKIIKTEASSKAYLKRLLKKA